MKGKQSLLKSRHTHDDHLLDVPGADGRLRAPSRDSQLGTHWLKRLGAGGFLLLLLSLFALVGVGPALAAAGQITEFPLPASCVAPCGPASLMVRGSDGNLWFSTQFPTGLGRITPTGKVSLFSEPNGNQLDAFIQGTSLTVGSDGNVWFLESTGDVHDQVFRIGRITTAGQITEFLIPAFKGNRAQAHQLTAAPDGNVWFTSTTLNLSVQSNGFVGRITPAGVITEFGTPTAVSDPGAIAIGSDNNVWFTEMSARAVGRASIH